MQCQLRELEPGPINTFPGWQALGRNVKRGERALILCMPITRKVRDEEAQGSEGENGERTFTSFMHKARWFVVTQTVGEEYTPPQIANWDADRALSLAAALEGDSEHLIAQAVRRYARDRKVALPSTSNFSALKGRGVQAEFENQTYFVGGPRLLEMLALTPEGSIKVFTDEANNKAQSVVYLTNKEKIIGAISIADVIRPESKQAVEELSKMGIEVAMLTGDSQAVAKAVANQLGIQRVFAEVLPEHKDQKVLELQKQGKRVAMVGDGVNDAPALTRADVGIAIGGGTDVAIESAGLILVNSNPLDVVKIFKLSRASYNKMVQNLWWAAGYNIVAIPLAAGVLANWGILLSPAVGALLMSVSTIVVAINAQLLRRTIL